MRIAVAAPLNESVPPRLYGGTERVVSYLTEELVAQGHDVTLFASGDSITAARLEPVIDCGVRLSDGRHDPLLCHLLMLEQVYRRAREFDVVHFHVDMLHFSVVARLGISSLNTFHGRLDIPDLVALARCFPMIPLVSISDSQREPLPFANWVSTVHHGLPATLFDFHPGPGKYLAFLGRIAPEKRPDRAIAIARAAGIPLKIAAKVDRADVAYYEAQIKPLLRGPGVEYVGEIGEREKNEFLGNALALLFPIDWPEPFGLVMIEAMACGTPVIAYRSGSVPEILEDGLTGYIVQNRQEAIAAVERAAHLDRRACRGAFERRFTAARMASDYAAAYRIVSRLGAANGRKRTVGATSRKGVAVPKGARYAAPAPQAVAKSASGTGARVARPTGST